MFWFILTAFLLIVAYFTFVKPFNHWKERGIDQLPFYIAWREIFIIFMQRRSIADQVEMIYNSFPGRRYCGFYQLKFPVLAIKDPDLLKQVLVKDFDHFVDHMQFFSVDVEPLFEKNLFVLQGDTWRDLRATITPSFTGSKMRIIFSGITETAKQFVQYFEAQKSGTITLEMKDAFTRFTNDVIATAAFGVSCDSMKDPNNTFYRMGKEVTTFGFWQNLRFITALMAPKIAKMFGITLLDKQIINYFSEIVIDNIRTREREGIVRQDIIHLLMEAKKERSKDVGVSDDLHDENLFLLDDQLLEKGRQRKKTLLTDEDIVAQAIVFFFAGFDAVATLMCFMAHELAVNPDVQERLQCEIDETLNDCGGTTVTYEALSKMKYMNMVALETLRKWPGTPSTDRLCTKAYTIPPVTKDEKPVNLKKGDVIWVPTFGIQRDPKFYPNPERFDPERFSDENKSKLVPYTYFPFGAGPRLCIGNRFALMETKLAFFYILSKFDIVVVEKTTVPLKLARSPMQLLAEGGFWLGLKPRK